MSRRVLLCIMLWCGHHTMSAQSRLIVKLKQDQHLINTDSLSSLSRMISDRKLAIPTRTSPLSSDMASDGLYVLEFGNHDMDSLLYLYNQSELFSYAEPDYIGYAAGQSMEVPNDPEFDQQWYLHNDGSFNFGDPQIGADIQALTAWELSLGSESITVAIIDSGINPNHREFVGRFWQNDDESDGQDNDHNGYTDDYYGWDFVNDDNDPTDDNGHGTAVAGVLAANGNNGFGYAGIDWHCRLMVCKVVGADQLGYYSDWISAIYYAVKEGADVINFSLVGIDDSRALKEAVDYAYSKGILIVASMGNANSSLPNYPAAYVKTLAVGASDPDDQRSTAFNGRPSSGSNYGDHIDIVAPGNYILGLNQYSTERPGNIWAGTSMAAPMTTGIVSLLLAVDRDLLPSELTAIITSSCEDQVGRTDEDVVGWDIYYGWGRLNAALALQSLINEVAVIEENKVLLYPNPASTWMTLRLKLSAPSMLAVSIVDTQGHQVKSFSFEEDEQRLRELEIDVRSLPSGLYILQVQSQFGTTVQRFIILH